MSDPAADADAAIRTRAGEALGPGDVVVSWFSIAGVRHPDGGGYVILDRSDDTPPDWQVRGMLMDALAALDSRRMLGIYDDEDY